MEREESGDFHPIINEWEGAWVGPGPGVGNLHTHSVSPKYPLILVCEDQQGSVGLYRYRAPIG
jgi:hypothetical protein